MINKKSLSFMIFTLIISLTSLPIYAMQQKGQIIPEESCLATLLRSFDDLNLRYNTVVKNTTVKKIEPLENLCWNVLSRQHRTILGKAIKNYCKVHGPDSIIVELIKKVIAQRRDSEFRSIILNTVYLLLRTPVDLYPTISTELLNSSLPLQVTERILKSVCLASNLDYDTKRILKMFKHYCANPTKYSCILFESLDKKVDTRDFNLSWHALLDVKSDAPYKLLLKQKKLLVPGRIINYLLKMRTNIQRILSTEEAQQILRRLHFVLEYGASPDTNVDLESKTSFEHVLSSVIRFKACSNLSSFSFYEFGKLNEKEKQMHLLFFHNVLKLFVEHVKKKGMLFLYDEKYKNMSTDELVDYITTHRYKRNYINNTKVIFIDYGT